MTARKFTAASLHSQLDLTPMVAVLLTIFAVLILGKSPPEVVALMIDSPQAQSVAYRGPTTIARMGQVNRVELDGRLVAGSPDDMVAILDAHPSPEFRRVFIRPDPDVPYERVEGLIARLHRAGYNKIGLISEDTAL